MVIWLCKCRKKHKKVSHIKERRQENIRKRTGRKWKVQSREEKTAEEKLVGGKN